jgi:hypothetical protein
MQKMTEAELFEKLEKIEGTRDNESRENNQRVLPLNPRLRLRVLLAQSEQD